jgi:hypothetical protein
MYEAFFACYYDVINMREYISADLSFSAAFFILQKMGPALHSPSGIIM